MALVRWTLILGLAGVLNHAVFATAYSPVEPWQSAIPGALAVGQLVGVWMLARGRTAGLFVLAICCLLLPPASAYWVARQPVGDAERWLFAALFLPGWAAAVVTLGAFVGPVRRFLRS